MGRGETFKNLREGLLVRELVVTPGCSISMTTMKNFLATEVLEIYKWKSGSKISWWDI